MGLNIIQFGAIDNITNLIEVAFRIIDSDGTIIECNDAFASFYRLEKDSLVGRNIKDFERFEIEFDEIKLKLETEKNIEYYSLNKFSKDTFRIVESELNGHYKAIVSKHDNYFQLLESIGKLILNLDYSNKTIEVNDQLFIQLGYKNFEEFKQNNPSSIFTNKAEFEEFNYSIESESKKIISFIDKCSTIRYYEYEYSSKFENYYQGLISDISDQILKKEADYANFEQMRVIIETIPYPIFAKNTNLEYVACNKAFEYFMGKTKAEIIGKTAFEIAPKELAEIYNEADLSLLKSQENQIYESKIQNSDKSFYNVVFHKAVYKDKDANPLGIVGLIEDITKNKRVMRELEESEKRFRALIENSADGLMLIDKQGEIYYQSNSVSRILGRDAKSRIGKSALEFVHDDDINIVKQKLFESFNAPNKLIELQFRIKTGNEEWRWMDCIAVNLTDEPAVNSIVLNFHDITEEINSKNALDYQLRFMEALIDSIPYPIFIKDANARFVGCNKAYEEVFGIRAEYMIGKTVLDLEYLPIEDRIKFQQEDTAAIKDASRLSYELPIVYADGLVHTTLYTIDGFRLKNGEPGGLIGLLVDISVQKKQQEDLMNLTKIQSLILDNSVLGISLVRNSKFEWLNNRTCEIFKRGMNELIDMEAEIIFPTYQDFIKFGLEAFDKLNSGENSESIMQLKRGDGSDFWCRFIGRSLDVENPDQGTIWFFEDISERVENEEKINMFIKELKELNATKDKFFSIIAHDLKNPLGNFREVTKILQETYENLEEEDRKMFLSMLNDSANNIYSLLENLLEWSRSQRGVIQFSPSDINLEFIVANTIQVLSLSAENKNISFETDLNVHEMYADANLLTTIIRNLCSNAVKFTPIGGTITISSMLSKSNIIICVADNGVGMTKETMDKLFRIDETISKLGTSNEKGTGLGLILCKEFVEIHNGEIWVESELGKGSKFNISLPITK